MEEKEKEEKEEKKDIVVNELPTIFTREAEYEGKGVTLVTRDEALTEILKTVREIKKVVG